MKTESKLSKDNAFWHAASDYLESADGIENSNPETLGAIKADRRRFMENRIREVFIAGAEEGARFVKRALLEKVQRRIDKL